MPTDSDLDRLLDDLDDYTLNMHNYLNLENTLENVDQLTASTAEKLLSLCIKDRIEDLKFATHAVNIIATLLKKIQNGQCTTLPNLVPSALAILNVLERSATVNTVDALKTLCFDTLLTYPDETLITLCVQHSDEIFDNIETYCHKLIPAEIRVEPLNLLAKLLRILPPKERLTFVKDGIDVWFLAAVKLIPLVATSSNIVPNLLETLELLTDQLVQFHYVHNEGWLRILENICTPERYPSLMTGLLDGGNPHWHRLWIIFIKLLKSQLTKCISSKSPINALLPCVEKAFKMKTPDRCRAFLCWNFLVENYSKETNEVFLNKRLKLLMVPLTPNNAKVEEVALAKFKTWWNLIACFQTKMDKFSEMVIIPFLSHCFGKPTSPTSDFLGKISKTTKVQCVQAFINIVGHAKCEGCVALPRLNVKLLSAQLLASCYWEDWIHFLSSAIRICIELPGEFSNKEIQCVWTSFIKTIAELPENNIRRDLFKEALTILEKLRQECDDGVMHVIVNVLVPSLFDGEQIQALFESRNEENAPFHQIVALLSDLPLERLDDRKTALKNIKMLTDWGVDNALKTSSTKLEWFVNTLSSNGLMLWTALAQSLVSRVYTVCPQMLAKMILWPINYKDDFISKEESTAAWLDLFKCYRYLPTEHNIYNDIVNMLFLFTVSDNQESYVFVLNASIAVLEQKLQVCEDTDLDKDVLLFLHLSSRISEEQLKSSLPSLAGIIVHILNSLKKNENIIIAERIIIIIKDILRVFNATFQQQPCDCNGLVKFIEDIFNALESTFQIELYSKLKVNLVDQLKACAPNLKHETSLNNDIFAIYKKHLNEIVEVSNANLIQNQRTDPVKLNTPRAKVAKKSNKEASVINTVVENGEEFAVIKRNYKFNPRKLTDNQKEKLQRKRDIPALYQDLSQSQDEFKLTNWKMDSQDTTTTSSSKSTNTASNADMPSIFKNIPNSEFLPKIIENVIKPADNMLKKIGEENSKESNVKKNNIQSVQRNVEDAKSPRMALRDRILRNKRSLTETYQKDDSNDNFMKTEYQTPLTQKIKASSNITKSAQMTPERPSRVKRTPKKFDETQLIPLTKRRLTLNPGLDVKRTKNINDMTVKVPNGEKTVIENMDKAKNDNSQEFINISSTTVNYDNANTPEQHENDTLVEKIKMIRDDTIAAENITSKKAVGLKSQKEEKANSCVDANVMTSVSSDKTQKIEENICASDTITNTCDFHEINGQQTVSHKKSSKKSRIESQLAIDMVEGHPILNVRSKKRSTISTTVPACEKICHDNEIDIASKSGDKTQKIGEQICASDTSTNSSDVNETIELQTLLQKKSSKKKSRIESQLAIDMVEGHPLLKVQSEKRSTTSTTVPTRDKICHDDTEIDIASKSGDKTQKIEEKLCASDTNTNTFDDDDVTEQHLFSPKKSSTKKSRIESQLVINMVEGHPLMKTQSQKQSTEKEGKVNSPSNRKRLSIQMDYAKHKRKSATEAKNKRKKKSISIQDTPSTEDISASQDFIESSQDSGVTTISVKPSKLIANKEPVVVLKVLDLTAEAEAQNLTVINIDSINAEGNSDIELPCNKTNLNNLTEEMDTQSIDCNSVIDLCVDEDPPISRNFEEITNDPTLEQDTENTAEADTQFVNPDMFLKTKDGDTTSNIDATSYTTTHTPIIESTENDKIIDDRGEVILIMDNNENELEMETAEDKTNTLSESVLLNAENEDSSSSCNNEQRKKDFIDDTIQISPIKSMSPIRNQKSPSPETSSDFVTIKLTSPVQSNGEPFESCESPEIFTEDKISPDKRDQSPPREDFCVKNTSPSSSLSLKKNRPQMRSGGRAAQMLGMCVSDSLRTMGSSESLPTKPKPTDVEEVKRSPSLNSSARRNLRALYNSSNNGNSDDIEKHETFLTFKRSLPSPDRNPAGPILKRKLIDITDEASASPASKRKRVSFHDPPVSTTVCVKKYIDPISLRSPQNSANKRVERRTQIAEKSPKRLDSAFKLDSVLTKAIESFSQSNETQNMTEDIEMSSLDETPVVEVVKTSDLNNTDPICAELVDCEDHIEHIAAQLSSPAMKTLFVKTFAGKVETIGDLAKMTELEVNRLGIKAPKVQVAKEVLNEYLLRLKQASEEIIPTVEAALSDTPVPEAKTSEEAQTHSTPVQSIEITPTVEDSLSDTTVSEAKTVEEAQTNATPVQSIEITPTVEESLNDTTVPEAKTSEEAQTDSTPVQGIEITPKVEESLSDTTVPEAKTSEEAQTDSTPVQNIEITPKVEESLSDTTVPEAKTSEEAQTDSTPVQSIEITPTVKESLSDITVPEAKASEEAQTDSTPVQSIEITPTVEASVTDTIVPEAKMSEEAQTDSTPVQSIEITPTVEAALSDTTVPETKTSVEVQTDSTSVLSIEMLTKFVAASVAGSESDSVLMSHIATQTDESGSKSPVKITLDCLTKIARSLEVMNDSLKLKFAESLSFATFSTMITSKISRSDGSDLLDVFELIEHIGRALKKREERCCVATFSTEVGD